MEIFIQQIKKYLAGAMSAREADAFKAALEQDDGLKKTFLQYSISTYVPPSDRSQETRKMVEETYEAFGAVPEPALPWTFQLRMLWDNIWGKLLLTGGGLAVLAFAIWLMMPPKPDQISLSVLIHENIQHPFCPGQAALPASDIFCNGQASISQLEQLTKDCGNDFCIAEYYLAHKYLQEGRYDQAIRAFDRCLAHYEVIGAYIPADLDVRNALIFNRLLAETGAGNKTQAALKAELDALLPQWKDYKKLREDAEAVSRYLNGQ